MATDSKLSSPTARARLKARVRHWRTLSKGVALGYWRGTNRATWLLRQAQEGKYKLGVIGIADDRERADGVSIFSFEQAQEKALSSSGRTSGPLTVRQAIERYLEHVKVENGEKAERDARSKLGHVLSSTLADKRIADLEIEDYRRWLRGLVKRDLHDEDLERRSKDTANRVLSSFKAALNHSAPNRMGKWHDVKKFKEVARAREDHFSEPDAGRLIKAARKADPCFADLLEAAFYTGARAPGELAQLDVRHFDAAERWLKIIDGKTGPRLVQLSEEGAQFFKHIVAEKEPDDILLPHRSGGRWDKNLHVRPMRAALKAAKLSASASLYSMRHTYISRAIERGMKTLLIAENVGTSLKMIEQNYAHVLDEARKKLIEAHAPSLQVVAGAKKAA